MIDPRSTSAWDQSNYFGTCCPNKANKQTLRIARDTDSHHHDPLLFSAKLLWSPSRWPVISLRTRHKRRQRYLALTCASRLSVVAMRSSSRSPRSITFSMFCVITSFTSFTCDCSCPSWSLSGTENFSCTEKKEIFRHSSVPRVDSCSRQNCNWNVLCDTRSYCTFVRLMNVDRHRLTIWPAITWLKSLSNSPSLANWDFVWRLLDWNLLFIWKGWRTQQRSRARVQRSHKNLRHLTGTNKASQPRTSVRYAYGWRRPKSVSEAHMKMRPFSTMTWNK